MSESYPAHRKSREVGSGKGIFHARTPAEADETPVRITQGVACIPVFVAAKVRFMATRAVGTSELSRAIYEVPVSELREDLRTVEASIAQLQTHAELLRLVLRVRGEGHDSSRAAANGGQATGSPSDRFDSPLPVGEPANLSEKVILVLNARREAATLAEVCAELAKSGWLPEGPNARPQVSARLTRMIKQGRVVRLGKRGRSRYTLPRSMETEGLGGAARSGPSA
jgi:hypothetical protein